MQCEALKKKLHYHYNCFKKKLQKTISYWITWVLNKYRTAYTILYLNN